eukprot:CAMPEP_0176089232 /NCGR_PEP_ID=MMETSP0120_2-20121206/44688_1 /TAXON_ID=160619 /ORGANISM="Kryptoperidinium foliaceum, Strain CCMP 1326" /LENGTH=257 /DNA_ID=CAMNT_0017423109 /DNA_START=131 /DNA_END=904 /DNA_ORIENTATION=-
MSTFSPSFGASYEIKPKTGFSSALMDKLTASRALVEQWVQHEKAKIEKVKEEYRQEYEEQKKQLDAKNANLLAIQFERGLTVKNENNAEGSNAESIAKRKDALEQQQKQLESEIEKLREECSSREKRLKDITEEEEKQRSRAQSARALKAKIEETKKTTVDDLTRGLVNYKHTGLDFVKTEIENELLFTFTKIDPADPSRQFSFLLQLDANDNYEITQCKPALDASELIEIAKVLNDQDEMSYANFDYSGQLFAETL